MESVRNPGTRFDARAGADRSICACTLLPVVTPTVQRNRLHIRHAVLACLVLVTRPLGAQTAAVSDDPLAILTGARAAQTAFEQTRRSLLEPPPKSNGGRCDERIGRFCYWYDGDDTPLPVEPPGVSEARRALLADLAARAERLPHDEWIAGQRVRYLVEAGDVDGAVAVAEACRVASAWCEGLRGFAYHAAGREREAATAFQRSWDRATPARKCILEDLSPLLDEATAARYLDLDCNARRNVNRRFLWLADPFLGDSVNDLANALHARQMMHRLLENSANAFGFAYTFDQGEMILRYGWSVRWTRSGSGDASVQGHEARPAFIFAPSGWWEDIRSTDEPVWDFAARGPRLRYSPTWLRHLRPLAEGQTALFRRRDSTLLVAVMPVPEDSVFGPRAFAVVALSRSLEAPPAVAYGPVRAGIGRVIASAPWYPLLFDVAIRDTAARAMARRRVAPDPMGSGRPRMDLSDLLLVAPDATPRRLEDALDAAVPSLRLLEGSSIAIYWEMYGFPAGAVNLSLLVVRHDGKNLPRLGAEVPAPRGDAPIRLTWKDERESRAAIEPQTLGVDLSRLRPGGYLIVVEAEAPGVPRRRTALPIIIERAGNR